MSIEKSELATQEGSDNILVRKAGGYSSEDLHYAVFNVAPEPRTLKEMKEGIRSHIKQRHARG